MSEAPIKIKMFFKKATQIRKRLNRSTSEVTTGEISLTKMRLNETAAIKRSSRTPEEFKERMAEVKAKRRKEDLALLKEKMATETAEQRQIRLDKQRRLKEEKKQRLIQLAEESDPAAVTATPVLKSIENLDENNNKIAEMGVSSKATNDFMMVDKSAESILSTFETVVRENCGWAKLYDFSRENIENEIPCSQRRF